VELMHFVAKIEYSLKRILYVSGRYFLSKKETSCHRKKLTVAKRNLQPREETSRQRKKLPVTGRNFLP
jgi:hypothetical protein